VCEAAGSVVGTSDPARTARGLPVSRPGRRRRGHVAALSVLVCALLAALGGPVLGQQPAPTARDLGVDVQVGFGRGPSPSTWNPITVTVAPVVPVRGQIEARAGTGFGTSRADVPVEVAAGAERVVHLLLPPSEDVRLEFVQDDGTRTPIREGALDGGSGVLLGHLGAAPPLPAPLNTAGTDRPVTPVAVDPAVIALGAEALQPLSTLVVTSAELRALGDLDRAALDRAVASGLAVVVLVAPGDDAPPLGGSPLAGPIGGDLRDGAREDAWAIAGTDVGLGEMGTVALWRRSGSGSVSAVSAEVVDGSAATRGLWRTLVQVRPDLGPTLLGQTDEGMDLTGRLFGGTTDLPGTLGFLAFALLFVVLVGPVNALVLRRLGRRELLWVTVPAVTVVFTAIAAIAATTQANASTPVTRAAWWVDGVGQEVTVAAVQAPRRGTVDVSFPGRRTAVAGTPWSQTQSMTLADDTTTTVRLSLESLQVAAAHAWGRTTVPPPLTVDATVDAGRLDVEVTNDGPVPLDGVTVRFATSHRDVGRLEPGQTATARIATLDEGLRRPHARPDPWMRPQRREDPGPEAAEELLAWNVLAGAPGIVWTTGHAADDLGLAVPTLPGRLDDRGTFVAVGTRPLHAAGDVVAHEVARDVLATWQWAPWRPAPLEIEGAGHLVLRYHLPAPPDGGTLTSTLLEGGDPGAAFAGGIDPWMPGCFEVEVQPADGASFTEERCGNDVVCPGDQPVVGCSQLDERVQACFEDGTCQVATPVDAVRDGAGSGRGIEVWDHADGVWLPHEDAFDEERRATGRAIVSPIGEVLVRFRADVPIDVARRGLEVRT
jgi:hypothetical protein